MKVTFSTSTQKYLHRISLYKHFPNPKKKKKNKALICATQDQSEVRLQLQTTKFHHIVDYEVNNLKTG